MILSRQKLLRERWLWALGLAILVHVGFFLIFYLNVHKDEPAQVAYEPVNIAASPVTTDIGQNFPPSIAKTYTATDSADTMEKVSQNDAVAIQTATVKEPAITSNTDEIVSAQTLTEDSAPISTKPISTLKERAQRSENLNPQTDEIAISMPSNSREALEGIKTRAGLLSIDIPTEQPHVKIDPAYLSVKSEVEDINSQLSAAINEVKKRNQQKIDESQQLRNNVNIREGQDGTGNVEQEVQDD